jgi:hypothetical protein
MKCKAQIELDRKCMGEDPLSYELCCTATNMNYGKCTLSLVSVCRYLQRVLLYSWKSTDDLNTNLWLEHDFISRDILGWVKPKILKTMTQSLGWTVGRFRRIRAQSYHPIQTAELEQ